MNVIVPGHQYKLFELGGGTQDLSIGGPNGVHVCSLVEVVLDRTRYLNQVLPCNESLDAICFLEEIQKAYDLKYESKYGKQSLVEVVDQGHIYTCVRMKQGIHTIRFVKRSGGAITYQEEWSGTQTQEVLRAIIDRTKYLINWSSKPWIVEKELEEILLNLKNVLFLYEVRAYRRKQEKVNRKEGIHDDSIRPKAWKPNVFDDIPFTVEDIESFPINEDGHIIFVEKSEHL